MKSQPGADGPADADGEGALAEVPSEQKRRPLAEESRRVNRLVGVRRQPVVAVVNPPVSAHPRRPTRSALVRLSSVMIVVMVVLLLSAVVVVMVVLLPFSVVVVMVLLLSSVVVVVVLRFVVVMVVVVVAAGRSWGCHLLL